MAANAFEILKDDNTLANYRKGALEQAATFDLNIVLPRYEELYDRVVAAVNV